MARQLRRTNVNNTEAVGNTRQNGASNPDAAGHGDSRVGASRFHDELLGTPTAVMNQYLAHFGEATIDFLKQLESACVHIDKYVDANAAEPRLVWSAAYFLNSINTALISTRLFLQGYIVASGNQARHCVESLAFGVLLPFPATGAFRDWNAGRDIEHKALERLVRSAEQCGIKKQNVEALRAQAKWFDTYSHPSRLVLASAWVPETGWELGALFDESKLAAYRKEMTNRVSLGRLISRTITGTHRELARRNLLSAQVKPT